MTKQEAIAAMREGKKVKHQYFTDNEWMKITPTGNYLFEDGVECPNLLFWQDRKQEQWQTGWSIYEEPTPEGISPEQVLEKYLNDKHGPAETYRNILKAMVEYASRSRQPSAATGYTKEDIITFAQNMISQYKSGNTNIENRELLKESLESLPASATTEEGKEYTKEDLEQAYVAGVSEGGSAVGSFEWGVRRKDVSFDDWFKSDFEPANPTPTEE